jgi:hypothetical protein
MYRRKTSNWCFVKVGCSTETCLGAYADVVSLGILLILIIIGLPTFSAASEKTVFSKAIPDGHVIIEGDMIIPEDLLEDFLKGTYEPNLWPNGRIPYQFEDSSEDAVVSLNASDISFAAGNPPQILSASTNFLLDGVDEFGNWASLRAGDDLLVSGSDFNDNTAGNGYTAATVTPNTITLIPTDVLVNEPAGNPVQIISTATVTPGRKLLMKDAMAEWEAVADLDFVVRAGESAYIHIQHATVNNSEVGWQNRKQIINISAWESKFIMAHELAHALAIRHEHTRPDREAFVQVNDGTHGNPDNVSYVQCGGGSCHHNFTISPTADAYPLKISGVFAGIYDFGSVMHYGQCGFSDCNDPGEPGCDNTTPECWTITVRPPWDTTWQSQIGQRDSLSYWDKKVMSFLYRESNWRFVHVGTTGSDDTGTFLEPYTTSDLNTAIDNTPSGGRLIILYPHTYSAVGTYDKPRTIEAPVGGVTLQ